ncbi:phage-related baseplate assembly protein [Pseudomonas sp. SJZ103]|uniref:baseplate assembly protein n=1 Tax=unclassified Pseudomonas TaxID=196821 RepID=UPI0011A18365|nr:MULTISPECIES: baseplate J/gp47 family protein [unclassified Pseudomonas]TWC74390.1 phage-related baseplate assembly protein [Pseudomonas sp. SJZ103]TWC93481.1 phage-related baseplate assembly protein [Pseudomonas sp. SJZ094]
MRELPKPEFVKIDPAATEAELIASYELESGKSLFPAQIERLFLNQVAYSETRIKAAIQNAGEKLLVRFSGGPILDYLGDLVGTPRLLAVGAVCSFLFVASQAQSQDRLIPTGTRITTQNGAVAFLTRQDAVIKAGTLSVQVRAICETVGVIGNGWAIGQINTLVGQPFPGLAANNDTVPADGVEDESDDHYKERIILAPEAYTTAGSRGAYRYHALSVHQSIIDVAVRGPDDGLPDGEVAIHPLTETGMPTANLLEQVESYLSGEKLRPLCDTVRVQMPDRIDWRIRSYITLYSWADKEPTLAAVKKAAETYAQELRVGLGIDIVPEQLNARLQVMGVYRSALELPANTLDLQRHGWADCSGVEILYAGSVDG